MRTVYAQKNKKIILGRQGEDKAVRVVWPGIVSDWSSLYGDGSFQLSVRRFGDENAYPVVVEVNGDDIRFTVTSAETAIAGNGKCELTYIANGTIAKSATWETVVLNSLTGQEPSEPPKEPAKSWFTAIQGQIGDLANLATASKDNLVAAINEAAQSGGGGGASVELDTTLTQSGKAADAKAVGDALAEKQPKGDYLTQNELPDMTAYRTAEAQDVIDAGKQDALIQSGAIVGQIAKITAVDSNGKPTAWEAVDMPSGGGGGSAQRVVVDTTLSDSASEIIIDSDSDGNVFRLREAHIVVELPANSENAESSTTVWIYPDSVGSNPLRITGSVQNKTAGRAIILNVFAIGNTAKNVIGSIGGNYVYAPNCPGGKLDDFFSYLRIESRTTGNSFAAGTRIVIWGVDA